MRTVRNGRSRTAIAVVNDLTGGCEIAVEFRRAGWRTFVSTGEPGPARQVDLHVVSTETRNMLADDARRQVAEVLRSLPEAPERLLLKKIDSTSGKSGRF